MRLLPAFKLRLFLPLFLLIFWAACQEEVVPPTTIVEPPKNPPKISILVDGLLNPVGIATLPNGAILVAEEGSGKNDDSAGVTLITPVQKAGMPDPQAGRLISGLPSGRDSGDLSGVPFVAVSPDGTTLYTSHFGLGHLLSLDISDLAEAPASPLTIADLTPRMMPLNDVKMINPFDLTFDDAGIPVVSDASGNGVAKETADGATRFIHRFEPLSNPQQTGTIIDPVPTGIAHIGGEYFVTLTGGCPYPDGGGQLVAIDEDRNQRIVVGGLNMPIDVAQAPDGSIWLLEFARFDPDASCFSGVGYLPNTGRLSKLVDGSLQPVIDKLNFPAGVAFADNGDVYISELVAGRILHVSGLNRIVEMLAAETELHKVESILTMPAAAPTTAPALPNSPTSAFFQNQAAERGIGFKHGAFVAGISADPAAMMGGGLCWLDYNQDGWLDLYLVNSHAEAEKELWETRGGLPANQLFRNNNGHFTDVSRQTGADLAMRGNGCVAADFNQDGWSDIYITTADGANALLWNNGEGSFHEGAEAAGVAAREWSSAAAVTDLNGDGLPDLFVAAYIDLNNQVENPVGAFPQDYYGLPDRLYLNKGDGAFEDVAAEVGLTRQERGLGAIFADFDDDGNIELYIANDGHPNRLYTLQPAGNSSGFQFVDLSQSAQTNDSGSGMGVTVGDFNGDALSDLFVTNWQTEINALYQNEGEGGKALRFRYSSYRVGISGLGNNLTGWGTSWGDFDNDSDQDLLVVNGMVPISDLEEDRQLARFYGNRLVEGQPNQWREWTDSVGLGSEGVGRLLARGSAMADFDNDGDLDVAVNVIGGEAVLLVNVGQNGNWLMAQLPAFAANAVAWLTLPDGTILKREIYAGSSYLASEDPRFHFGLGEFDHAQRLEIRWGGQTRTWENVPANQLITFE